MRESSTCKRQRQLEAEVEELHSAIKILNANNEDLKKTLADKESSLEDRTRANEDKRARLLRLSKEKSELANDNRILSLAVGNIKLKNEELAEENDGYLAKLAEKDREIEQHKKFEASVKLRLSGDILLWERTDEC